jgi:hypothetical protein
MKNTMTYDLDGRASLVKNFLLFLKPNLYSLKRIATDGCLNEIVNGNRFALTFLSYPFVKKSICIGP